jgi:hypothetical protein
MRPTTLAAACLVLVLSTALATTAHSAVPAPHQLRQWNPSESWPGGEQYDPRLEKTVTFWNAGIPLAEVFRKIEEQTGVSIGFRPAGDVNARICVNLYLNPNQPPSLREVMAQLGWAVDCTFSYEGDGGEIRYSLLSTSMGEGDVIEPMLADAWAEQVDEYRRDPLPQEEILREREELRKALGLKREEAIRRCRGSDDFHLLNVLDPVRRAVTELFVALPLTFPDAARGDCLSPTPLSELPPEQRGLFLEALRPSLLRWQKAQTEIGQDPWIEGDPAAWLASLNPRVSLLLSTGPGTIDVVAVAEAGRFGHQEPPLFIPVTILSGELGPGEQVALRRLLGEINSPEDESKIIEEWNRKQQAREPKEPVEAVEARDRHEEIPPETEQLLNSVQVVPNLKGMYALWQVQEAVARASGLNIISDCFWQPYTRDLRLLYLAPGADTETPPTALMVLKAATVRLYPWRLSEMSDMTDPFSTGWEWRGAGQFLTFRSLDRDIWRAAFLPAEAVQTMDAWVEPALPPPGVKKAPTLTPDWRALGRLVVDLSEAEIAWGGLLTYGDPTDYREACRQSLRERMLSELAGPWEQLGALRLIGSLSDAQWQEVHAEGLAVGSDLPLATVQEALRGPQRWAVGVTVENVRLFERGFAVGDVLRMHGGQTEKTEWEEPQPTLELQVMRRGQRIGRFVWRTSLALYPRPVDSIPLPPTKAGAHPSAPRANNSPH